jgi:YD repeat-containing protein
MTSGPFLRHGSICWTWSAFDPLGRATESRAPADASDCQAQPGDGRLTSVDHLAAPAGSLNWRVSYLGYEDGLLTTSTDPSGRTQTRTVDVSGRLAEVRETVDVAGRPTVVATEYGYDAQGNMTYVRDAVGNETHVAFNIVGHKVAMTDPDTGAWAYQHNALGELVWQQDALGQITEQHYD